MPNRNLIFYDGDCGLCDQVVQFLLKQDKAKIFDFAPLGGITAAKYLNPPPEEDTVVLIENYLDHPKSYTLSRAAFRTLWLLGGGWSLIGLLSFLPSVFFDWGYRLVARHRKKLFPLSSCILHNPKDSRFLK